MPPWWGVLTPSRCGQHSSRERVRPQARVEQRGIEHLPHSFSLAAGAGTQVPWRSNPERMRRRHRNYESGISARQGWPGGSPTRGSRAQSCNSGGSSTWGIATNTNHSRSWRAGSGTSSQWPTRRVCRPSDALDLNLDHRPVAACMHGEDVGAFPAISRQRRRPRAGLTAFTRCPFGKPSLRQYASIW